MTRQLIVFLFAILSASFALSCRTVVVQVPASIRSGADVTSSAVVRPGETYVEGNDLVRPVTARVHTDYDQSILNLYESVLDNENTPVDLRRELSGVLKARRIAGGSAFPVWTDGQRTLIATNSHVIEQMAEKVRLSFNDGDDEISILREAKVVYVDPNQDLAFLMVPYRLSIVELYTGPLDVGTDVVAAGYPGLRGMDLMYQAQVGTVANTCYRPRLDWGRPYHGCLIHHSAAIDAGNSGGPLFLRNTRKVVGVNSYGRDSRNSFYLAIPASEVKRSLREARYNLDHENDAAYLRAELTKSASDFFTELASDKASVSRTTWRISARMVTKYIVPILVESDYTTNDRMEAFAAENLWSETGLWLFLKLKEMKPLLRSEDFTQINPNDDVTSGRPVRMTVGFRTGELETFWVREQGMWRLMDVAPSFGHDKTYELSEVFAKAKKDESEKIGNCRVNLATGEVICE